VPAHRGQSSSPRHERSANVTPAHLKLPRRLHARISLAVPGRIGLAIRGGSPGNTSVVPLSGQQAYPSGFTPGPDDPRFRRLQFGLQFNAVRDRTQKTDRLGWSSMNRYGRLRPELLMRLGFQRSRPMGGRTPHQLRQHVDASCGPVAVEALDFLESESRVKMK
jgi:hypothetical protein